MSKKSTSKTVTTPTNPEWVTSGLHASFNRVGELGQTDPYQYVPPADPLQLQAAQSAANLGGNDDWYQQLMASAAPTVSASNVTGHSLLQDLEKYMSPYTQQVVDTSIADFDVGADRARARQALQLAGSTAFNSTNAPLLQSLTEGELGRGRGALSASIRDQGFKVGAGLSGEDANRRQQADIANQQAGLQAGIANQQAGLSHLDMLARLGLGKADSDRADIVTQMGAGGTLRDISNAQARAPLDLAQWTAATQSGLPLQLFHGENSTSKTKSSDPFGSILQAASLFAAPVTGGFSPGNSLSSGLGAVGIDDLGGAIGAITGGMRRSRF